MRTAEVCSRFTGWCFLPARYADKKTWKVDQLTFLSQHECQYLQRLLTINWALVHLKFSFLESLGQFSLLSIIGYNNLKLHKCYKLTNHFTTKVSIFYQSKYTLTITIAMACYLYYHKVSELNVTLIAFCLRYLS